MKRKSVYKYAAEAGVPVGLYLTLMSACLLFSVKIDFTLTLLLPLVVLFPFYLGYFMRRIGKLEPGFMKFSSLWLSGIYSVIFGTLICMLFSGLYIVFVEPGFVGAYFSKMIEAVEMSPMAESYESSVEVMRNAMETRMLPSGMDFVTTMGWFTCFSGSIVSLILAFILSRTGRKVADVVGQQS